MTVYGYARVSSTDQNLDRQREALADVDKLIEEKQSGKNREDRPRLEMLLDLAEAGDVIRVKSTDRLARNTADLLAIVRLLTDKNVGLEFVDNPGMNVGTSQGELMLTVFAAFAQFERELIRERQAEGIAAAKARGVYANRPKKLTPEQVADAAQKRQDGASVTDLAKQLGVSRQTLYTALKNL
ncbi:recombinase family protein [Brevibacterium casei]|uniref:recombinase family protein n=3 Tax=Bacteria TaxID=2 RepID=UPI00223AF6A1|nr:recombinase family protein [Brevibacterium casei]MCT1551185.1 recombinase family protein [Brevibacterium casei]MCT1560252.1 recombinase family protein [Brevibacterium casei]MCT1765932.1 recombinase family protein [Brevibacterium casei]MCT2207507.1 recombinase family protein [Brevibacterium casei]MCT2358563.1 recombinase family protein [Brevibacterium casei]